MLIDGLSGHEDTEPHDRLINYGVVTVLLLLVAAFFIPQMMVSVHSGEAGVLWDSFSGTRVDIVYGQGIHTIAPWNRFYKYDVRPQSMPIECEALSRSGLPFRVSATVRFRLAGAPFVSTENSLGSLHQRVGPDYREKVVSPIVAGAVREVLSRYRADDLYPLQSQRIRDEILNVITDRRTRERFTDEQTVDIIDVRIGAVTLPKGLRVAIDKKLAVEQAMLAYDITLLNEQKEAQRKSIEAAGVQAFNNKRPHNRQ